MIVHCPSCATRYDLPTYRLGADGVMMKCSACGHDWIEGRAVEVAAPLATRAIPDAAPAAEPDLEVKRLVAASREAQEAFLLRRRRRRTMAAAWAGLMLFALGPAVGALAFPEAVVTAAPASIRLYEWLGREVNVYGLEIGNVELQHLLVDGERMIAVKGEVRNVSSTARKIPWLRFGLTSGGDAEVYSWQLDTGARPLRPGEATGFTTRVASPPENARSLQIRFARADEIGSNTTP
ncbi:zinc-ribbon domain-containing protein [Aestuariivirga sp.]|uniref:zinc-ribbon domain-containing protein n=1 Tax=Aestuariivirga sp. TaxID=2650926 RepID=UPI00391A6B9E